MFRIGFIVWAGLILSCNGKNGNQPASDNKEVRDGFSAFFKTEKLPYQLADTALASSKKADTLPVAKLSGFLPDTLLKNYFGRSASHSFSPIAMFKQRDKEGYYLVEARAGNKKAAYLIVLDDDDNFGAAIPFLLPDNNANTLQWSSIDKGFNLTRAVLQKSGEDVAGEGKEVLAYDATEKKFSLIMTDMLSDNAGVAINPIDTFPKKHKLAGDYFAGKKNILAIRDGRYPNQLLVYIHTENEAGDCKGELKGEFIITSSTTAQYRQGGDPCVLRLNFKANSVTINEESGCGNHRGLDCPLTGTFTRKKDQKQNITPKKKERRR